MEARLIKDIQPQLQHRPEGRQVLPLPADPHPRGLPAGRVHPQAARAAGVKLYGPFTSAKSLRAAIQVLQQIFKFRTCSLDIKADDERWRWFRPCLLHSIHQCTAPCNFRVSREDVPQADPAAAPVPRRQEGPAHPARWSEEMQRGEARRCSSRRRPGSATRSRRCKKLNLRGDVAKRRPAGGLPHRPEEGPERAAEGARPGADAADDRGRRHRPPGRRRTRSRRW